MTTPDRRVPGAAVDDDLDRFCPSCGLPALLPWDRPSGEVGDTRTVCSLTTI